MNTFLIALVSLIVGFSGGYLLLDREPVSGSHVMPGGTVMDDNGMTMGSAMDDMTAGISGKTGDDFDKAFLSEMIVHHQGAVQMAKAASTSAKHPEIKQMAKAIIDAQTREIAQMRDWQKTWYNQ